ncbi:MAG: Sua5/YciO/YrdC/YwlC family protein [Thiomicrospira sp.]|uniref:L-threonylcarbamoyladenylate synthase n=1 Tax=Thiomicrospira sp. TaxID=935 RepID=UPI001A0E66FB|nr:Sua5/YciO/YrdC/YwlC family protein [Thiomicrospira sp.]MBE0493467.1 Sua5/YciO/YrdC/YwlC family protein [Thiomicrospira sp.]
MFDKWLLQQISDARLRVQQGRVIAYPTEAVYGLGCDPLNQQAVTRLLELKQRPQSKGLILIAAEVPALAKFCKLNHQAWSQKIMDSWKQSDQAISWVVPKTDICPNWISGDHDSVAVRLSHHPIVQALCGDGVLVSTSANPATQSPAKSCQQVAEYFNDQVWCLDAHLGGLENPSQIWDAQTNQRIR